MNKFALGTVQFGQKYGISNKIGQVSFNEVKRVLKYAKKININLIDTAISYGDSEKIIGNVGIKTFKVVTKLPAPSQDTFDIEKWVRNEVKFSLNRLGLKSIYGLLIHNSKSLLSNSGEKILKTLYKLKSEGTIKKVGLSVYDPSEIEKMKELIKLDIVQIPLNIFDQRFLISGWLSKLFKNDIEIHARSIFLQGLLLMSQKNCTYKFGKWHSLWKLWYEWLNDNRITALEATTRYALSMKEISKVIVGVESKAQLEKIVLASNGKLPSIPLELSVNDMNLLNPSNWKKL